jgi:Fe-S oxidoreductase
MARLAEAKSTGADILVTACPKCRIHFSCALSGKVPGARDTVDIPIEDMTSLVARALGATGAGEKTKSKTRSKS